MMLEFDLPFIYDDHEYWSRHSRLLLEMEKLNEDKSENANLTKIIRKMPKKVKSVPSLLVRVSKPAFILE